MCGVPESSIVLLKLLINTWLYHLFPSLTCIMLTTRFHGPVFHQQYITLIQLNVCIKSTLIKHRENCFCDRPIHFNVNAIAL